MNGRDNLGAGGASAVPLEMTGIVAEYLTALREVGVVMGEPFGHVCTDHISHYARIGTVVIHDDGTIEAIRCVNTTATQVGEVLRQAEAALFSHGGPSWRRVSGLGWEASILEPVDDL